MVVEGESCHSLSLIFFRLTKDITVSYQYTYVLAGALDVGTLAAFVIIFLGMGLTSTRFEWGGNTIYTNSRVAFLTSPN
jgi:hypothetical protein